MARGTCIVARMDKLNRRVIYLSDDDWGRVTRSAKIQGITASAVLRLAITVSGFGWQSSGGASPAPSGQGGSAQPLPVPSEIPARAVTFSPAPKPSAKKR